MYCNRMECQGTVQNFNYIISWLSHTSFSFNLSPAVEGFDVQEAVSWWKCLWNSDASKKSERDHPRSCGLGLFWERRCKMGWDRWCQTALAARGRFLRVIRDLQLTQWLQEENLWIPLPSSSLGNQWMSPWWHINSSALLTSVREGPSFPPVPL